MILIEYLINQGIGFSVCNGMVHFDASAWEMLPVEIKEGCSNKNREVLKIRNYVVVNIYTA